MLKSSKDRLLVGFNAPFSHWFRRQPKIISVKRREKSYTFKIYFILHSPLQSREQMNFKIDTKEKFTVIKPEASHISANMTEELNNVLIPYLGKPVPHVVLSLSEVDGIDPVAAEKIAAIQQEFYEQNCSFIVCELKEAVEKVFDDNDLLELMNVTPTESEAWDIVQMEEIERELMSDFDEEEKENTDLN